MANTKKGQMELLGLAIVVVIVSVGMMYLLVFMVGKPPKLLHRSYVEREISQNFISALLKTQSQDCRGLSLGELLQDCANFHNTGGSIRCGPEEGILYSCDYAQQEIENILVNTVYKWRYSYRFRVFLNNDPVGEGNRLVPKECSVDDAACPGTQHCAIPVGKTAGNCVLSELQRADPSGSVPDPTLNPFNPQGLCTDSADKETPGVQPVPIDSGVMTVMLEICRV